MKERLVTTLNGLRDLLTKEQTQILKAASLLMLPALLTKATGLVYQLLTATQLGTTAPINEFNLASTIPQLLADILLTGAISTLVIPIFVQAKEEKGEEEFLRFYNTVINILLGFFGIVSLLIFIFAEHIFPFIVTYIIRPDGGVLAGQLDIPNIIMMIRALMLPQMVLGLSVFVAAGINVHNRFLIPQLAPLFYNVGRVFAVFVLLPLSGNNPWALVAGVYIGSVLHLLIQLPLAEMLGLRYRPVVDLSSKYIRNFIRVSIPRLIAYTADTVGGTLSQLMITGFNIRFTSVMNYSTSLANIVPGVIGYAFSVASFPTLSRLYTQKKYEEINQIVIKMLNQMLFLAAPVIIALMILRLPIVRLAFGLFPGTSFSRVDTLMVAWTLLFFSIGIIFSTTKWYLYRLFYVAQNTWVPFFISFITLGLTVALTMALGNLFSHAPEFSVQSINFSWGRLLSQGDSLAAVGGASLAISITSVVEFSLLLFLVDRYVIKINFKQLFTSFVAKLIPIAATSVLMYLMYRTWDTISFPIDAKPGFDGSTTVNLVVLTGVTAFTSFMVYYLLCYLMQIEELKILRRLLNPLFKLAGLEI
jgi:putative peptidoglycan lipid II flippase